MIATIDNFKPYWEGRSLPRKIWEKIETYIFYIIWLIRGGETE